MALSDQERRSLEEIERRLHSDDPSLAGRMSAPGVTAGGMHPDRWAWLGVLVGLQVTLIGLAVAAGLISFGTIIALYGSLLLTISSVTLLRRLRRRRADPVAPRTGGRHSDR